MTPQALFMFALTAGYTVITGVFLVLTQRIPQEYRRPAQLLALCPALGAVDAVLQGLNLGTITVGAGQVIVSALVVDVLVYVLIFGGTAVLGNASARLTAAIIGTVVVQRVAFSSGNALATGTPLATLAGLIVIGGYPILGYLFIRPVWAAAQDTAAQQRLIHWKARNLLLLAFGLLVAGGFLYLSGAVSSPFLRQIMIQYPQFFFRVGVPAAIIMTFATNTALTDRVKLQFGEDRSSTTAGN